MAKSRKNVSSSQLLEIPVDAIGRLEFVPGTNYMRSTDIRSADDRKVMLKSIREHGWFPDEIIDAVPASKEQRELFVRVRDERLVELSADDDSGGRTAYAVRHDLWQTSADLRAIDGHQRVSCVYELYAQWQELDSTDKRLKAGFPEDWMDRMVIQVRVHHAIEPDDELAIARQQGLENKSDKASVVMSPADSWAAANNMRRLLGDVTPKSYIADLEQHLSKSSAKKYGHLVLLSEVFEQDWQASLLEPGDENFPQGAIPLAKVAQNDAYSAYHATGTRWESYKGKKGKKLVEDGRLPESGIQTFQELVEFLKGTTGGSEFPDCLKATGIKALRDGLSKPHPVVVELLDYVLSGKPDDAAKTASAICRLLPPQGWESVETSVETEAETAANAN